MPRRPEHHPEYSDEFLLALGTMHVSFAKLEDTLGSFIWILMGVPDARRGYAVTANMRFKDLVNTTYSLFQQAESDAKRHDELHDLLVAACKLEERRNRFTHSIFATRSDGTWTSLKFTARLKHGARLSAEHVTVEGAWLLVDELVGVTRRITDFYLDWIRPHMKEIECSPPVMPVPGVSVSIMEHRND